jgi:phosphopantothenoylcysteine decarboxylase/phosphopantothenate--cysteine ligase
MILKARSIVLGVTGGIAAYKAAALCSLFVKAGALVDVILTSAAARFITPLTFQALTHRPVITDMFSLLAETEIGHVTLGKRANLLVIAPATANTIAKLACGMADNMLTTTALAARCPILIAPAMESHMWENPLTQQNLERLQSLLDVTCAGPAEGYLASGASGVGRMLEPQEIFEAALRVLARGGSLAGRQVMVTAGGTREPIDPVRYISNRSSGQMGYALADAARDLGAQVTLVSTTGGRSPYGIRLVPVETAAQMRQAVLEKLPELDVLVMAAAVADYQSAQPADQKIKKGAGGLSLKLVPTADILAQVAELRRPEQVIVGFAAETEDLLENARGKLQRKHLDLIVANDALKTMGAPNSQVTLLHASGEVEALPEMSKEAVAEAVFQRVAARLAH